MLIRFELDRNLHAVLEPYEGGVNLQFFARRGEGEFRETFGISLPRESALAIAATLRASVDV